MKAVLMSIKPQYCEFILKKTVEVRKSKPKLKTPFKVYIYCTKDKNWTEILWTGKSQVIGKTADKSNSKVIGEFICDKIFEIPYLPQELKKYSKMASLTTDELGAYLRNKEGYSLPFGYGWHISNLKIYEDPKELSDFAYPCDGDCPFPTAYINPSPPCENCRKTRLVLRAPQSWRYVEELL